MKYISTRNDKCNDVDSAFAIKQGLCIDGGLYMPKEIPTISINEIQQIASMTYPERAANILSRFLTDYTYEELLADATRAYSGDKFDDFPAKVRKIENGSFMLELWHGPTAAFKDMALQLMPLLFVRALKKCNEHRTAMILVATSGDTGKAALEGYCDVDGTKIQVFYPIDGVSEVQKLQMQTQTGSNVSVIGINGNFDDAQTGVKRIFSDCDLKEELNTANVFLSSANSINWGRLVPQIVYYISAYADLVSAGEIMLGDKIDVCVPTGNFGNIFACYVAKKMGLPVSRLICASNENNVLTDFLNTGCYNKNREFHTTMSPSMDILISSNLERLLYTILGSDKTCTYMLQLGKYGKYQLDKDDFEKIKNDFIGYYTNEEETAKTIKDTYENKNCLIDTHTAVALSATNRYKDENKAERVVLTVSTASPYKFASDVYESLTGKKTCNDIDALKMLKEYTNIDIPHPLRDIGNRKIVHSSIIEKESMPLSVKSFARGD